MGRIASYRCDCPNQKTVNGSWPGYPPLPQGEFIDAYGVRMVGQFLVTRPADGVIGETKDLFPAASDYHLVCLQHDDSAQMIIDGMRLVINISLLQQGTDDRFRSLALMHAPSLITFHCLWQICNV